MLLRTGVGVRREDDKALVAEDALLLRFTLPVLPTLELLPRCG